VEFNGTGAEAAKTVAKPAPAKPVPRNGPPELPFSNFEER
jgi:hypothetical protein